MVHQIGLFFHMAGILIAGGGSIGAILAEQQLWKNVNSNPEHAKAFLPVLQKAPKVIMIGLLLFLVSGLMMLYSAHWIFLRNPWFITKLVCFLLLPIRGAMVAGPTGGLIARELHSPNPDKNLLRKLQAKMKTFHLIQFLLVAIIIFLIIFKV